MRVAEFLWTSPPPSSIDEQLVVYDDGAAWLVVRRPIDGGPTIGSYVAHPSPADLERLASFGPGPRVLDLVHPGQSQDWPFELLSAVAGEARGSPEAIATFHGRSVNSIDADHITAALVVLGAGNRPVEFELDPARSAVHFFQSEEVLAWRELPEPQVGFVTADAAGLGGLRTTAFVPPGGGGLMTFPVEVFEGADSFAFQVAGWLESALPDDASQYPFEVRTERAPVVGA